MENCIENFLNDVVKVQIYRTQACQSAIPYGAFIYEAEVALGTPSIELMLTPTASTAQAKGIMVQTPTLKVSSKPTQHGTIYTHEMSAVVETRDRLVNTAYALRNADIHIIYIKADGTMWLSHSLPNTATITTDDSAGGNRQTTVKVQMKSASALISATKR